MLKVGMKHTEKMIVDKEATAAHVGSGGLEVFATPSMIALMEKTCKNCVDSHLDSGKGTVGISISTNHKAATPLGMEVRCECELVEVDRSRLSFEVKCFDEIEEIGEGKHDSFIVDNDKFLENVNKKIERSKK